MKKIYKILICAVVIVVCLLCLFRCDDKNNLKTVKSEEQLLEFYRGEDYELSLVEKLLTMPFSLLDGGYSYGYRYNYGYRTKSVRYMTDDVVEISDAQATTNDEASGGSVRDYSKTNIQVEGVDEADIIKTDGDYIYSISNNKVIITNAKDSKNTKIESKIYVDSAIPNDLLLYKNYLVIFASNSTNYTNRYSLDTIVEIYDVSDKQNVKRVKSLKLNEQYYTSRCIDGNLYVFSKGYLVEKNDKIDRSYKEDNKTKEIGLNDIKYLKDNDKSIQTLIAHLDLNDIKNFDVKSYLIDISNAYVSKNNIYLLDYTYADEKISIGSIFTLKGVIGFITSVNDRYDYNTKSKIYKFNIDKDKGVKYDSSTMIEGTIVNQYSLDEKDNHLRIALQTNEGTRVAILDDKLKLLGETDKVAEGERMYASRFIGDKAYLVTYRNTDPLFVIDLSDEKNPEVLGELKIPGYSTYLHPYDDNHLIGIGMDTEEVINRDSSGKVTSTWVRTNGMKMCLFDISDVNNPKEIAKTTIGDSRTVSAILTNPKALLFSKEKNLLAIPVNNYEDEFAVDYSEDYDTQISYYTNYNKKYISEGYFVYNIDLTNGFKLKGIINHEKKYNDYYYYYGNSKLLRGVYIDNDLYTVSESYVKVHDLNDLSEISSLEINKGVGNE